MKTNYFIYVIFIYKGWNNKKEKKKKIIVITNINILIISMDNNTQL